VSSRTHEGWKRKIHHDAMRKAGKCPRCSPHGGDNRTNKQLRESRHRKTSRKKRGGAKARAALDEGTAKS